VRKDTARGGVGEQRKRNDSEPGLEEKQKRKGGTQVPSNN
jgi:hypothetical protein